MKIKGKLTLRSERAEDLVTIIAQSLAPDNVPGIETIIKDDSVTVFFEGEKVGTILSSVDDYLMNARIAYEILNLKEQTDFHVSSL
ncbi:MAG: KEOPS complex subunit Pcc1 [Candidatus Methanoperedens sp.]|nr:KEOPS complex subunit Pcc1 [Candidatus Methanoperedens sp.]